MRVSQPGQAMVTGEPLGWLIAIPDKGTCSAKPARARIAVSHTLGAFAFRSALRAIPRACMGCAEANTTGAWFTLRDRPALSAREPSKRGPSGDKQRPADRIAAPWVRWGGCFDGVCGSTRSRYALPERSGRKVSTADTIKASPGRGVSAKALTLAERMEK